MIYCMKYLSIKLLFVWQFICDFSSEVRKRNDIKISVLCSQRGSTGKKLLLIHYHFLNCVDKLQCASVYIVEKYEK